LSEDQLSRLLAVTHDTQERLWWLLMCDCGLRIGEVKSLLLVEIERTHIHVRGKGGRWRRVPVTQRVWDAAQAVRSQLGQSAAIKVCPCSSRAVQQRFDRRKRAAGMSALRLSPHSLRHSFATRALAAGIDIYRVGVLLGHRSIRTTVGYLHTSPEALREVATALDRINPTS